MKCKLLCTAEVLPDALFSTKGIEGLVGVDLERENADALGIGHNVANQSLFTGSDEVFAFGRYVSFLHSLCNISPRCEKISKKKSGACTGGNGREHPNLATALPIFSTKRGTQPSVSINYYFSQRKGSFLFWSSHNITLRQLCTKRRFSSYKLSVFPYRAVSRLNEMQQREYLLLPHAHHGTPDALRNWVSTFDSSV